jgi:PmbA protein
MKRAMSDTAADLDFLASLLGDARRAGADAADALVLESRSLSVDRRLGKTEKLERAESLDLGLRVFVGKRQAVVSGSDRSPAAVAALVERAVAMARVAPEDRFCGLADSDRVLTTIPTMDLADPEEPSVERLMELARAAEDAALAVAGVTNSEGGSAGWGLTRIALAATNGFAGGYARTGHSVSAVALAGEGTGMERDYDYTTATHAADLRAAEEVGRIAGERAVRRLGPRKVPTAQVPVVLEQRLAGGMLGHLASAINGAAIARGTSFLKDRLGERILPEGVRVIDDPRLPRGLASKPFDGEGLPAERLALVDDGVLTTWVLDLASARQLGLDSIGRAARGVSGPPSPATTNLFMEPGDTTPEALVREIERGLLVTEMMGMGVNLITGDYSRGAAGFWIEKGEIAYPVSEVTIAGNLRDMLRQLTPASDLVFRGAVNAPTLRIDGMTLAGI